MQMIGVPSVPFGTFGTVEQGKKPVFSTIVYSKLGYTFIVLKRNR
jgi:hypothetical protein